MQTIRSVWARPIVALLALVAAFLAFVALTATSAHAQGWLLFGAAVPTVSTTELDPVMKVIASRPLFNNTINESEFSDIILTNSEGVQIDQTTGGRYIENAHRFSKSSGYRGMQDGGYIPVAEGGVFKNSKTYLRQSQYTLQMTGSAMRRVQADEGAFINYLETELPEAAKNMAHVDDRYLMGFGYDVRARVNGAPSGTASALVIGVDSALGVAGWTDAWKMFDEGDQIGFTDSLSATIALRAAGANQRAIVRDIDEANNTITVETNSTLAGVIADNDYIGTADTTDHNFPHGSGLTPMIPCGLLGAVDDGTILPTYMNIARSGNRMWKGIVVDGSASPWGGAISESLVLFAVDETKHKGGGDVGALVGSYSAERGLRSAFAKDRFFMDPRSYTGGRVPLFLQIGNRAVQLKFARKLPPQVLFGLTTDTWTRHTMGTFEWDDTTGAIWNRVTDSTGPRDAYFATGYKYDEYFCSAPRKNFRIQGLSLNQ
mgnify:CR=1 FL=1